MFSYSQTFFCLNGIGRSGQNNLLSPHLFSHPYTKMVKFSFASLSLLMMANLSFSNAFVTPSPTLTPAMTQIPSTTTMGPSPTVPYARSGAATTSLSMSTGRGNFFDRFFRVASANINKFMNRLEDPEKVCIICFLNF